MAWGWFGGGLGMVWGWFGMVSEEIVYKKSLRDPVSESTGGVSGVPGGGGGERLRNGFGMNL